MPVTAAARKYAVSRQTIHYWLSQYLRQENPSRLKEVTEAPEWAKGRPHLSVQPRRVKPEFERLVLRTVKNYPRLGVNRLAAIVPQLGGQPVVGSHGIQRVLERNNLNTSAARVAYARREKNPLEKLIGFGHDRLKEGVDCVASRGWRTLRFYFGTGLVFFAAMGILAGAGIGRFLVSFRDGVDLELWLSSASLFFGMIFFAYSLKYYFTLALALMIPWLIGPGGWKSRYGYVVPV